MTERGEYRPIHVVLTDSPEFQALTKDGRLLLFTLKLSLGPSGIGVVYDDQLRERSALTGPELDAARDELVETEWLEVERRVHWLRNGLRYEPTISTKNANQRKGIERYLQGLPKLEIVNRFARYYGLEETFPHFEPDPPEQQWLAKGSPRASKGLRSRERERERERDRDTNYSPLPPAASAQAADASTRQPATAAGLGEANAGKSNGAPHPDQHTEREIVEAANDVLGLGRLNVQTRRSNEDLIRGWLYSGEAQRDRDAIWAAVHGAALLRDEGAVDWLRPGKPVGVRALDAGALRDQGDGKAVTKLWELATERYYVQGEHRTQRSRDGPTRVEVRVEPGAA
jgi:hypothetical protein